jgi:hypothetical protein
MSWRVNQIDASDFIVDMQHGTNVMSVAKDCSMLRQKKPDQWIMRVMKDTSRN